MDGSISTSLDGACIMRGRFDIKDDRFSLTECDSGVFLGCTTVLWEKPAFLISMIHHEDVLLWQAALAQWQSTLGFPECLVVRIMDNLGYFKNVSILIDSMINSVLDGAQQLPQCVDQISLQLVVGGTPEKNMPCMDNREHWPLDYSHKVSVAEALEQEYKRANYYLDIAGVILVTLDVNGHITLLNRFACDLLKTKQTDALGLHWFENFLPESVKYIAQASFKQLMKSHYEPNQQVEKPIVTRDGKQRLILWNNRVLENANGQRVGILSSGTDITEQRLSEQTLQMEKQRLRTLIDAIPDLIYFKNNDAVFIGCNKAFEAFSGKAEAAIIGKTNKELFDDEVTVNTFQYFEKEILHSRKPLRHDEWVTYPDGRRVLLDTLRIPLYTADTDQIGMLGVSRDITAHTLMSRQLSLVNAMVDHSLDSLICTSPDEDFRIIYANTAAVKHFGIPAAELYQTQIYDWDPNFSKERLHSRWKSIQKKTIEKKRATIKTKHLLRCGAEIPIEVTSSHFSYHDKNYMITVFKDIRDRLGYEKAVEVAEHRSRLLLEHSNEGIFGLDLNGLTTFINPAAAMMLGYDSDELIGKENHSLIHHSHADGTSISKDECHMLMSIRKEKSYRIETDVLWRKDNQSFPVEYWSSPIYQNEEIVGAVVTFHDISHRKQAEEQIRYLAFHDSLTGLPNRRLFLDRFEQDILQRQRSGQVSALLIMDLDHFKDINDTLGHPAGDQLLIEVVRRVKKVLSEHDTFARFGGDEFTILQSNINDPADVAALAEKVIACFDNIFDVAGDKLKTNTSIGIVICDADVCVDDLISRADVALYRAKELGRGRYVFYQLEMSERVQKETEIAHMLSSSDIWQQFYMVYQPQFDCQSGLLVGFEALLRWAHPEQGIIPPSTFIPVAEKRGMIDNIGTWVAQQVCIQVSEWLEAGLAFGTVSFNISPVQLRSEKGMTHLLSLLDGAATPLNYFEIEITESACMDASEKTIKLLETYVSNGLKIAIDDFGTGYSSLVTLRQLSACRLKIDQSFIRDMLDDVNDEMIVKATIALAQSLGLEVVAEGVESKEQMAALKAQGCDVLQGYFLGLPMTCQDATVFLRILGRKSKA